MKRAPFRLPDPLTAQIQAGLTATGLPALGYGRLSEICEEWWNWEPPDGPASAYVYGVLDALDKLPPGH